MKFISATCSVGLDNSWWINFSRAAWSKANGNFIETRDKMLQEYGARLIVGGIEFEHDEQATLFLLRWS
jgi:hypothetical protein